MTAATRMTKRKPPDVLFLTLGCSHERRNAYRIQGLIPSWQMLGFSSLKMVDWLAWQILIFPSGSELLIPKICKMGWFSTRNHKLSESLGPLVLHLWLRPSYQCNYPDCKNRLILFLRSPINMLFNFILCFQPRSSVISSYQNHLPDNFPLHARSNSPRQSRNWKQWSRGATGVAMGISIVVP